jgi:hypothetical protein
MNLYLIPFTNFWRRPQFVPYLDLHSAIPHSFDPRLKLIDQKRIIDANILLLQFYALLPSICYLPGGPASLPSTPRKKPSQQFKIPFPQLKNIDKSQFKNDSEAKCVIKIFWRWNSWQNDWNYTFRECMGFHVGFEYCNVVLVIWRVAKMDTKAFSFRSRKAEGRVHFKFTSSIKAYVTEKSYVQQFQISRRLSWLQ